MLGWVVLHGVVILHIMSCWLMRVKKWLHGNAIWDLGCLVQFKKYLEFHYYHNLVAVFYLKLALVFLNISLFALRKTSAIQIVLLRVSFIIFSCVNQVQSLSYDEFVLLSVRLTRRLWVKISTRIFCKSSLRRRHNNIDRDLNLGLIWNNNNIISPSLNFISTSQPRSFHYATLFYK